MSSRVNTSNIAVQFFEALDGPGGEAALTLLSTNAFPQGPAGVPSPRARPFIDSGAWDSNTRLSLIPVDDDACFAKLPDAKLLGTDTGRGM